MATTTTPRRATPTPATPTSSTGVARHRQPDESLLLYYALSSLLAGPLFPFVLLYRYFRFKTLRYEFDDEGISMRWGILFRREISLTYARIQDIHLTSNAVERWLGLGQIQIQTASGNAGAEMTIEGLKDFEAIRDDLYARMRGVADRKSPAPATGVSMAAVGGMSGDGDLAAALHEAAAELRRLREALARAGGAGEGGGDHV